MHKSAKSKMIILANICNLVHYCYLGPNCITCISVTSSRYLVSQLMVLNVNLISQWLVYYHQSGDYKDWIIFRGGFRGGPAGSGTPLGGSWIRQCAQPALLRVVSLWVMEITPSHLLSEIITSFDILSRLLHIITRIVRPRIFPNVNTMLYLLHVPVTPVTTATVERSSDSSTDPKSLPRRNVYIESKTQG